MKKKREKIKKGIKTRTDDCIERCVIKGKSFDEKSVDKCWLKCVVGETEVVKQEIKNKNPIVGSYIIPKSTIDEMNELIKETHKDGNERGIPLCSDWTKKRIVSGEVSLGDKHGVFIQPKCKHTSDRMVGSFHTHPDDNVTFMSPHDLYHFCYRGEKLSCVGRDGTGEINCFSPISKKSQCLEDVRPLVEIENQYENMDEEDVTNVHNGVNIATKRFIDKHFEKKRIL